MSEYRVLDLFAGLGGFSSAFEDSERWDVTTVDIEAEFDPDIVADVFDLRPSDFEGDFDVVLASPPCTQFSFAASSLERFVNGEPQTGEACDAVALVYHAIGVIRGLSPTYWFMENPRGWLRQVIGDPNTTVTYCQYGTDYMKPTDIWGEHPLTFEARRCATGDGCHTHNTDQAHGGKGNMESNDAYSNDSAERSLVPYELSASIRDACEAALDGDAPVQTSVVGEEWSE